MARRSGTGKPLGVVLMVLGAVVLVVLGVGWLLGRSGGGSGDGVGGGSGDGGSGPFGGEKPAKTQPADCPDVELVSVPGTWESSATDDPIRPSANPQALLLSVTGPLEQKYPGDRLKVWTVPYTAQFRHPQRPADMTYDDSRREGTDKARAELAATHAHCPYTKFALLGFSQGAVIAGDLAAEIGTGGQPVPADTVLGTVLVADGRRQPGVGQSPSPVSGNGQGMEISLQPGTMLTQLAAGATMTGPRPGGFGALDGTTAEICAADDLICNAPLNAVDGVARLNQFLSNNAVHAQYATNPNVILGSTVPAWTLGHLSALVDGAEHVAHR